MTKFVGLTALLIASSALLGAWTSTDDRIGVRSLRWGVDDVCCAAPPPPCCAIPDFTLPPPVESPSQHYSERERPLAAIEAERPRAVDG